MSSLKELGRVTRCEIIFEGHGLMSVDAVIDFGGSGQGFGGFRLDGPTADKKSSEGTACGCDFILRLMRLFKADTFSEIKGKRIYAIRDEPYGMIVGLEIPACEDNGGARFIFADWQERWRDDARVLEGKEKGK